MLGFSLNNFYRKWSSMSSIGNITDQKIIFKNWRLLKVKTISPTWTWLEQLLQIMIKHFLILFIYFLLPLTHSLIHDCMQFEYVTTNRFQFWKLTDCLKIFIYATKNITFTTFINEGVLMAIFLNEASPRSESSARPRRRLEFQGRVHPQYQKPFLGHLTIY